MKTKILLAGIGGVGGFIGARLALYAEKNQHLEIYFLCRSAHLEAILSDGLELESPTKSEIAHPFKASDSCHDFPKMDIVFLCCKTYQLAQLCSDIRTSVDHNTLLIPVMNGIENAKFVASIYPNSPVANSCIYTVSQIEKPGKISMLSDKHMLYIDGLKGQHIELLETYLSASGVSIEMSENINLPLWRKFSFISPLACISSAYGVNKKQIIENPVYFECLKNLFVEILSLAKALNIGLPENLLALNIDQFKQLPDGSSSSMERDYRAGKDTEVDPLCHFVLRTASLLNIQTPHYLAISKLLIQKDGLKKANH